MHCPIPPRRHSEWRDVSDRLLHAVSLPAAGGLIEGSPGVLYSQADGTVIFSLTTKGVITYLATIQDPPYILESVPVGAANGLLYASYESVSNTGFCERVFRRGGWRHAGLPGSIPSYIV